MVAVAIGTAVAGIGGGLISAGGAKSAANAQVKASQDAQAAQERMYQQQVALQEPFRQAGITSQNKLLEYMGLGGDTTSADYGKYAKDFSMADYQQDPGYQFRLDEGMKALQRSQAARGMLSSGSTLKGIENYAQGEASKEYQNAFNRYQVNRSNQLNPLQSLMGSGQSATNTLTGAAAQAGQNEASNIYNAGQARASGYMGAANALGGALSGLGNNLAMYGIFGGGSLGGAAGGAGTSITPAANFLRG